MMSLQRRKFLLMVSVSLLLVIFTSVQFQAQQLLPPPPAPGESAVVPVVPDENVVRVPVMRDAELLQNGGFETAGVAANVAANWKGINLLTGSGRVCNRIGHPTKPDLIVAQEGNCAFRFNAEITNVKRQIKQAAAGVGSANDTLEMSFWASGTDLSNKPRAQVVVTYVDNTKKKFSVVAPDGTYAYTQFSGGITLTNTPKKIVVKFIVVGSGRLFLDGASLRHEFFEFAPTAVDDSVTVVAGTSNSATNVMTNDTAANPAATVTAFGGGSLGGAVTDNAAGATVAIPQSGGITVTLAANGALTVDATAGSAVTGTYTFDYQLTNAIGSDTGTVTVNVQSVPVARADAFTMLVNGNLNANLNSDNGSGADAMGVPAGTIVSFGGGSLGGDVTGHPAGAAVSLAGGTLTVAANGAITLSNPLQAGQFTFSYRLSNAAGFSDALVTITINKAPNAVDDGPYNVIVNTSLNVTTAGNDLLDNDDRGYPPAQLVGFGLITPADHAPGQSVSLAGGTLTVNADGSFSLASPTLTGPYTFYYAISNIVGSDTATVTINVQRAPIAENDAFNMLVNGTLNGDLKANNGSGIDIAGTPPFNTLHFGGGDLGGGVLSNIAPSSVTLAGGTLTINADGTFSLVNPTQTGVFTFSYRITNTIPAFDNATVTIEVRRAPTAVDDGPYVVGTGQTLTVTTAASNDLLDNDTRGFPQAVITNFGGGNVSASVTDLPAGGTANNFGGGNLTVSANGGFTLANPTTPGTYTFLYRLANTAGFSDATVTIQVQLSPDARSDAFNVLVNGTLNGNLTVNNGSGADYPGTPPFNQLQFGGGDLGGTAASFTAPATRPLAGGQLTVNADGTISLVNPTQLGVFSFTYRLTNAIPASDDATVNIEVRKAPTAVNDGTYLVGTGQTLTITTAASNDLLDNDDRGYPLALISHFGGGSLGGTVTANVSGASVALAGGTLTVNANGSFTLTTPSVAGTYSFQYRLANVVTTSDATVTIQVQQSPIAQDDNFIVQINTTLSGDLNDDNGSGADTLGVPPYNSLTFGGGSLTGDASTNAAGSTVGLAGGNLTVNLDGTFSLVNPNLTGVYTFQYRLSNTIPASDDATVTIDVRATPVAQDDALIATYGVANNYAAGSLFANNGSGADFLGVPAATIVSFGPMSPTQLTFGDSVSFAGGTLTVNADGSFSLSNPTITGDSIFYYRLQNISGFDDAMVTITVQQAPVAQNDSFIVQINATLNGDLNDNNGSGADTLGYPVATLASFGGGSLTGDASTNAAGSTVGLAGGNLTVNTDGTFSLVNPTTTGVYTFQYRLSNTIPASSDATVTIDVRATPVAQDDALIAAHGIANNYPAGTLFANNGSGVDFLGVPNATIVSFGTASATEATMVNSIPFAGGFLTVLPEGAFGISNPTQTGEFIFYYRLQNASGFDDATVTITVQQAPIAQDDSFVVQINATLNGDLNDNNGSGADTLGYPVATVASFGGGDLGGLVTANTTPQTVELAGGDLTINADGTFSLVNPTTTGVYTFQYRLSNTIPASDDATVTIDVRATPVAQDDALIAAHGIANNYPAGTLFADNGSGVDFLGVPAATIVSFGAMSSTQLTSGNSVSFAGGTLTVNADGSFSLSNPTTTGDSIFYYRLQNVSGFDDATVTVTVRQAPTANNDAFTFLYTVDQTAPNSLFLANGGVADLLGYPAAVVTHFGGGSLGGTVTDNSAGGSVTLADGLLTVNANGSWSLTGQPFTPGTYTFEYRIANVVGASTATVTLNIQQNPVAVDDLTYTVISGQSLDLLPANGLLLNDTRGFPLADVTSYGGGDAGGTITTYAANTSVNPIPGYANGMLQINAAGTGIFTPPTIPSRFCGEFDFSYRIGNGVASDDADVKITVLCGPDAKPDLFNSGFVAEAGGVGLTGNLFADHGSGADDLGYEAAVLTGFSAIGGGATSNAPGSSVTLADGTLTVNADGSFTVASVSTPATYTFDYTITNTAGSDTATVTIVIDEAPRVTSITPANGAINVATTANVVINFSEPVNVAAGGITLECPDNTNITFAPSLPLTNVTTVTVDPGSVLPGNTLCLVTVVSSLVTDTDTIDAPNNLDGDGDGIEGPDFTSSFTTAPVAVDDAYTVTPHLTYDSSAVTPQAFSVRNNDDPADTTAITGFGPTLASANGTLPDGTNFITASGAGGRVVLNPDGTFLFYPDAGDTIAAGTAIFHYTITGGDTAQVTLTFASGELVWFVDDNASGTTCTASSANVGTQACPSTSPNAALGTAHTGSDTIFIAEGAYTCQITLKNNVKVIGDGATETTLEAFSGVTPVSGSSFVPYATFTGVDPTLTSTADCFTLGTGNTVRGLTIGNTTGYALASANAVGTLTVTDVSITGSGGMFSLTNGGTFNGSFNALASSGHSNAVIDLTNIGGAITHTSGTISHANDVNPTIRISGGNPTLTYSGSITKTVGGRVIDIQDTTANTISFTGIVAQNVAAGTGILIDDQTGGTVSFTTINLGTAGVRMTSAAITATDGSATSTVNLGTINLYTAGAGAHALTVTNHAGTLNITGGTINVTSGGRAINIDGPVGKTAVSISLTDVSTAGAGDYGVQLADISGTVGVTTLMNIANKTDGLLISNSSAAVTIRELDIASTVIDAVRLSTNTGSFTITGDGTAGNTNGAGGTFSTVGENAFDLMNVQNITLNDITITGTGSHAFTGMGVNNLAIDNVDIANSGNADDEHVFNFKDGLNNLTGTVTISDSDITNFTENGMYVENFDGALNLTVSNTRFENNITTTGCGGGNCNGMGILLRADGTASMTVLINSVTFDRIDGIGVSANPEGNSAAFMDIDITNSTFTANTYGGPSNTNNGETAISLRNAQGNSTLKFNVSNNIISNYSGELALGVIEVEAGDFANTSGFINANTVNGAPDGNAIQLFADGANTGGGGSTDFDLVVSVTNNTVNGPLFGVALLSQNNGAISGSTVNAHMTIKDNNFNAVPTGSSRRPITVNLRDFNNACVNITGNTVSTGSSGGLSVNLSYNGSGTMRLQGMSGSGDANAVSFLNSNNTLAGGANSGPNNNIASATCTTPTP